MRPVVLAAFSIPKLYELKKKEIDGALKSATDKVSILQNVQTKHVAVAEMEEGGEIHVLAVLHSHSVDVMPVQTKQLYQTHAAPLVAKIPRASSAISTKATKADLSTSAESVHSTGIDAVLEGAEGSKKAI